MFFSSVRADTHSLVAREDMKQTQTSPSSCPAPLSAPSLTSPQETAQLQFTTDKQPHWSAAVRLRHLLARSLAEQRVTFRCPRVHFHSACSCRRESLPAEEIRYFPSAELWRELRHVHGWKPVNVTNHKFLFSRFSFKEKKVLTRLQVF